MRGLVGSMGRRFVGQERAIANAREASRELTRRAVEREEVRLFLEIPAARTGHAHPA